MNIKEIADSYLIQKDQRQHTEEILANVSSSLEQLNEQNISNNDNLDKLLEQAMQLSEMLGVADKEISEEDYQCGRELVQLSDEERSSIFIPEFEKIGVVSTSDLWDVYMQNVKSYAEERNINLSKDPFDALLTESEKNLIGQRLRDDYLMRKANCDKYDYIIAAFCGVVCGLIDSFFVGMPQESKLGNWTDKQTDKFVSGLSKKLWDQDSSKRNEIQNLYKTKQITKDQRDRMLKDSGIPYNQSLNSKPETLQQSIQYLEKKFGVNYDASSAKYLDAEGVLPGMRPSNHHIVSLAHSPSLLGLIFSIIDQFTGKATFIDDGKIIRVQPVKKQKSIDEFELRGSTFPAKLLCGFTNWLGHLCSDLVGSNGTRTGVEGRGSGIPVPFAELLQLCTLSVSDGNGEKISIAELTVNVFEKGYDLRFAVATAIPVVLNEAMIRILWSLKSRFYHKKTWHESIPFGNHPELRRMLLVGHGVLCAVDGIDARIRSVDLVSFTMRLNVAAWTRLAISGLLEIRAIYKQNVIDVNALDDDLEVEWERLYREMNLR